MLCAVSWSSHRMCSAAAHTASAGHAWRAASSASSSARCAGPPSLVRPAHLTGLVSLLHPPLHAVRWPRAKPLPPPSSPPALPCRAAVPVPVRCLDDVLLAAVDSQGSDGRERAERIAAWRAEHAQVTARWQQQLRPCAKRSRGEAAAQPPPVQRVVALAQAARTTGAAGGGAQLAAPRAAPHVAPRVHALFAAGAPPRRRGAGRGFSGLLRRGSSGAGARTSRVQQRRARR